MVNFSDYINECIINDDFRLDEVLLTFGGKSKEQFGNIVILAGGAGSGKGWVLSNLIGIQGRVFDVDALKNAAQKSPLIIKRIKELTAERGKMVDISKDKFDLGTPENVSDLHMLIDKDLDLPDREQNAFFKSVMLTPSDRKPNIIFDVTLKNFKKLKEITDHAEKLGYSPDKIHIVWVATDVNIAIRRNKGRSRVVPEEILFDTHKGAAETMRDILNTSNELSRRVQGSIYIAFNTNTKENVVVDDIDNNDTYSVIGDETKNFKDLNFSATINKRGNRTGSYVKRANYIKVKDVGKAPMSVSEFENDFNRKIQSYIPDVVDWKG